MYSNLRLLEFLVTSFSIQENNCQIYRNSLFLQKSVEFQLWPQGMSNCWKQRTNVHLPVRNLLSLEFAALLVLWR